MSEENRMNPNDSGTADELDTLLKTLNVDQLRYIVARQTTSTDREAARQIGVSPQTVCEWGEPVKCAVRLMAMDGVHVAREIRRRVLPKAMTIKADGLESKDEKIRQSVSTEIIEWEMGKATQRQEVKAEQEITLVWDIPIPKPAE